MSIVLFAILSASPCLLPCSFLLILRRLPCVVRRSCYGNGHLWKGDQRVERTDLLLLALVYVLLLGDVEFFHVFVDQFFLNCGVLYLLLLLHVVAERLGGDVVGRLEDFQELVADFGRLFVVAVSFAQAEDACLAVPWALLLQQPDLLLGAEHDDRLSGQFGDVTNALSNMPAARLKPWPQGPGEVPQLLLRFKFAIDLPHVFSIELIVAFKGLHLGEVNDAVLPLDEFAHKVADGSKLFLRQKVRLEEPEQVGRRRLAVVPGARLAFHDADAQLDFLALLDIIIAIIIPALGLFGHHWIEI